MALLADRETGALQRQGDVAGARKHAEVAQRVLAQLQASGEQSQVATTAAGVRKAQLLSVHLPLLRCRLKDDLGCVGSRRPLSCLREGFSAQCAGMCVAPCRQVHPDPRRGVAEHAGGVETAGARVRVAKMVVPSGLGAVWARSCRREAYVRKMSRLRPEVRGPFCESRYSHGQWVDLQTKL